MIHNRIQITVLLVFYLILSVVVATFYYRDLDAFDYPYIMISISISTIIFCISSLFYLYKHDTTYKSPMLKNIYRTYGIFAILYGIGIFIYGLFLLEIFVVLGLIAIIPALGSMYLGTLISISHKWEYETLEDE